MWFEFCDLNSTRLCSNMSTISFMLAIPSDFNSRGIMDTSASRDCRAYINTSKNISRSRGIQKKSRNIKYIYNAGL